MSTKQAIFMLEEEEYGLDIMDVNTIEKLVTIEPIANSPKNLKGMISLRGDLIPVYSLRRKFGLEDKNPDDETRLIITTSNGILMAYEVDMMNEIVQVDQDQLNELPLIIQNDSTAYIKQITNINERLVILLNHDEILSQEEQEGIKAILKVEKEKQEAQKEKEVNIIADLEIDIVDIKEANGVEEKVDNMVEINEENMK